MSEFVQSNEVLQFLHDILPPKVTYAEALEMMKNNDNDFSGSEDENSAAQKKKTSKAKANSSNANSKSNSKTAKTKTTEAENKATSSKKGKHKPKGNQQSSSTKEVIETEVVVKSETKEEPIDVHFEEEESNHVSSSLVEFEVEPAHVQNENSSSMDAIESSLLGDSGKAKRGVDHDCFN